MVCHGHGHGISEKRIKVASMRIFHRAVLHISSYIIWGNRVTSKKMPTGEKQQR